MGDGLSIAERPFFVKCRKRSHRALWPHHYFYSRLDALDRRLITKHLSACAFERAPETVHCCVMKRSALLALFCAVLLVQAFAQSSADDEVNGSVDDGVYTNDHYAFTITVPPGWLVTPEKNRQEFEKELNAKGEADIRAMLAMHRPASAHPGELPDLILVTGAQFRAVGGVSFSAAMTFLKSAPKSKDMRVIRPADAFLFGGLLVARQDYQSSVEGHERYVAHLAIAVRDRIISFQVHSGSRDGMERGITDLAACTEFQPDWKTRSNPPAANGEATNGGGTNGGGNGTPITAAGATRLRLSQASLMSLLDKRVEPQLPDSMTEESIKVPVQMHLLVSAAGDVEKIWVYEGDSNLTWPAVAAVRQWRFRPYMFEQKPVPIEATITIDFR